MITDRTYDLFCFVDFLHYNIDNFNQYSNDILIMRKANLRKLQIGFHYTEIIERRELEKVAATKSDIISEHITNPLIDEIVETLFNSIECTVECLEYLEYPEKIYDTFIHDVIPLVFDFEMEDVDQIKYAKKQYIEFRNNIDPNIICLFPQFFKSLDKLMSHFLYTFKEEGDMKIPKIDIIEHALQLKQPESEEVSTQQSSHTTETSSKASENEGFENIKHKSKEEEQLSNKTNIINEVVQQNQYFKQAAYHAKHYVLAFMFDCLATGVDFTLYDSKKKELEAIGEKRVNGAISGNTFYKAFNSIMSEKINLTKERDLIHLIGSNWQEIIIDLSNEPQKVSEYLKEGVF